MATNVRVKSMPAVDIDDMPIVDVDVVDLPTVDVDVNSLPDLTITEIGAVGPVTLDGIPDSYTVAISQLPDLNLRRTSRHTSDSDCRCSVWSSPPWTSAVRRR